MKWSVFAFANPLLCVPMTIWEKISDAASAWGGSLLAKLSGSDEVKLADPHGNVSFTIAVIALGAKMAKADGVVTADEITAFKEVFQVDADQLANVSRVFNLAKKDVAGYQAYAEQVHALFANQPEVLEDVLDSLFHIAKADGVVQDTEMAFLKSVAGIFQLSEKFRCIRARHIRSGENDPYEILGIDPCVDDGELKRLYRTIVRENHPDRHIAAGLPREMIAVATERLAAFNSAYEEITKERNL